MQHAVSNFLAACAALAMVRNLHAGPLDQWTPGTSGTGLNLYAVAYGAGTFVTAGQNGIILATTNPATWNPASSGVTTNLLGLAWGNGQFVAVGVSGTILTSSNGTSWTAQTSPTAANLMAVRFINGAFYAVGSAGTLVVSSNGSSWTARSSGSTLTLQGVAYGNGFFCSVGGGNTQAASITRSTDGITWSNQTVGMNYLYDVTFGRGMFVVPGIRGIVWVSSDGTNWSQRSSGDANYLYGATFAQEWFVAVGAQNLGPSGQKIATSTDGMNWTMRPVNTMLSPPLQAVTYGNGWFVAVGQKGIILQSGPVFRLYPAGPAPGGGLQWLLTGEAGRGYHFQYSDNLGGPGWQDVTGFTSTAETTLLTDPGAGSSNTRFYRVTSP
jgi:hypothetical protein